MELSLDINGRKQRLHAPRGIRLLDLLRDYAGLTGAKYGCGEGQCGACVVLVDGAVRKSCMVTAASAVGKKIVTIEGLAAGERLHPVQEAFLEYAAFQCGFCTPGMILAAAALLERNPQPSAGEIAAALQGHVCRCGVYPRILDAVAAAAARRKDTRRG
jgi:aerobic-type carbon monoxide dehydrogenase small subunit (CoxS/CutS family)